MRVQWWWTFWGLRYVEGVELALTTRVYAAALKVSNV